MYTNHIGVNWNHSTNHFYRKCFQKDLKRINSLFANSKESRVRVCHASLEMDDLQRFLISNRYSIILLVNLTNLVCSLCREKKRKEWYKSLFCIKNKEQIRLQDDYKSSMETLDCSSSDGSALCNPPQKKMDSPRRFTTPPRNISLPSVSPKISVGSIASSKASLLPKKQNRSCWGLCTSYSKIGYDYVTSQEFQGHFIVLIGYDRKNDVFFYRDPGTDSELCAINGDQLEKCFYARETDRDAIVVRML
jgi:hypothetical protein